MSSPSPSSVPTPLLIVINQALDWYSPRVSGVMHRAPASPQSRTHWIEGLRGKTNSYIMPADQEGIFPVHLTLLLTHSSFSENSWDAEHFLPTLSRACPCSGHSPWKAKPSLSPPSSSYPPYLLRYFCLELSHQTAFLLSLLTIHTQLKGKSSTSSNCRKAPAFQGRETCSPRLTSQIKCEYCHQLSYDVIK